MATLDKKSIPKTDTPNSNGTAVSSNSAAAPDSDQAMKDRNLTLVTYHAVVNTMVSILNWNTRNDLLLEVLAKQGKPDPRQLAVYLSTWTSATAAFEFLFNPTVGKLSDSIGRKPFMCISPYAAIVLKSWVLMAPSVASITVERIVCDLLRTVCGSTMCSAALMDCVAPQDLAVKRSQMVSYMGAAIIASPLIAARMSARMSYLAAISMAIFQLYVDTVMLKETLPADKKRPFKGFVSPFDVYRLFTSSAKLAKISMVSAIHKLMDIKVMADPNVVLQLNSLGWSRELSQTFTAIIGTSLLISGKITKASLGAFGVHGHTTFTHTVSVIQNLLIGLFPSSITMWLSGMLGFVGDTKGSGVGQMSTIAANECKDKDGKPLFGAGELTGLGANMRALGIVIGPFIYRFAYTRGVPRGLPGGAFVVCALLNALAEMMHRRVIGSFGK